jgi:hypothetical protein
MFDPVPAPSQHPVPEGQPTDTLASRQRGTPLSFTSREPDDRTPFGRRTLVSRRLDRPDGPAVTGLGRRSARPLESSSSPGGQSIGWPTSRRGCAPAASLTVPNGRRTTRRRPRRPSGSASIRKRSTRSSRNPGEAYPARALDAHGSVTRLFPDLARGADGRLFAGHVARAGRDLEQSLTDRFAHLPDQQDVVSHQRNGRARTRMPNDLAVAPRPDLNGHQAAVEDLTPVRGDLPARRRHAEGATAVRDDCCSRCRCRRAAATMTHRTEGGLRGTRLQLG